MIHSFQVVQFSRPIRPFIRLSLRSVVHVWRAMRKLANNIKRRYVIRRTAAARSICPPGAAGLATPLTFGAGGAAGGLDAVGTGGFPGALGAPGLLPIGGAGGFGLLATGGGGGFPARELPGRELAGVLSLDDPFVAVDRFFFQGVAEPFAAAIPGNTATGFAWISAAMDLGMIFAAEATGAGGTTEARFAPAPGPGGGGGGGGGGGAVAALGLGGTSSR